MEGKVGSAEVFVKIISSDDHVFYVDRKVAMASSGTIKAMLLSTFKESSKNEIRFPEIPSHVLEKVLQYCFYKQRFTNSPTPIPEFSIEPEIAVELLMAANFLDC